MFKSSLATPEMIAAFAAEGGKIKRIPRHMSASRENIDEAQIIEVDPNVCIAEMNARIRAAVKAQNAQAA